VCIVYSEYVRNGMNPFCLIFGQGLFIEEQCLDSLFGLRSYTLDVLPT
jgi:hypothetical protein